ncbi:MAG: aminoglycoside phosphotransferase [Acidimicrobiales bacterium]|nr:MAG: aminoglycoside phosphotransferase [Acidimicrobiales bacterium]
MTVTGSARRFSHPFYGLPSDEQTRRLSLLAESALERWNLGTTKRIEPVHERENAVFRVHTSRGSFALRVHRAGYHDDAQLRSQIEWTRALASDGAVTTPEVVDTADGEPFAVVHHPDVPEPRQVSILVWVEGTPLSEKLRTDDTRAGVEVYRQLGHLLGGLHAQARRWVRPPSFRCFQWGPEGLAGPDPIWGPFWTADTLSPEDAEVMAAFRDEAFDLMQSLARTPDGWGLMHNDFLADNILVTRRGELVLLDFDDCGDGWFVFDLTPALVSVATREDYQHLRSALLDGYSSVAPVPEEWESLIPFFFAVRMATYVGWVASRRHTRFARELGPLIVEAGVDIVRRWMAGDLQV